MGGTIACAVCAATNPGFETYCVECGFLLASAPGTEADIEEPAGEAVELVESSSGRRFRLRQGVNTVGRENCDILLLDGTVSRRHAEVVLEDGAVTVIDLGSTNGTQVEGSRLSPNQPTTLAPGMIVRFGNATLALPGAAAPAEATIVSGTDSFEQTIVAPVDAGESDRSTEPSAEEHDDELDAAGILRGSEGKIVIRSGTITVGRRPGNDVVLADAYASGQHATITCREAECTLTDLGSTNGTTVNGARLEANLPQLLVDGDEVQIGQTSYRFEAIQRSEDAPETEEQRTDEVEPPEEGVFE
jgi:pSer/pThr/pTyr-binding forkhead associated (FHA) protein